MGTNYYHRSGHCDCCGRYDERHIGKSMVMFRGYRPDPDWPEDPTLTLVTWEHWKAALRADGTIRDEYGREWDVNEFIAEVESTESRQRRRQFDWMEEHYSETPNDWLDPDGFSFCDREFS